MNHGSGRRRGAGRSRPSPARYSCARSAFAVDLTTEDLADAIVSALPPDAGVSIVAELHDEYPDTPVVAEVPRPKAGLYPGAARLLAAPLTVTGLPASLEDVLQG